MRKSCLTETGIWREIVQVTLQVISPLQPDIGKNTYLQAKASDVATSSGLWVAFRAVESIERCFTEKSCYQRPSIAQNGWH